MHKDMLKYDELFITEKKQNRPFSKTSFSTLYTRADLDIEFAVC